MNIKLIIVYLNATESQKWQRGFWGIIENPPSFVSDTDGAAWSLIP